MLSPLDEISLTQMSSYWQLSSKTHSRSFIFEPLWSKYHIILCLAAHISTGLRLVGVLTVFEVLFATGSPCCVWIERISLSPIWRRLSNAISFAALKELVWTAHQPLPLPLSCCFWNGRTCRALAFHFVKYFWSVWIKIRILLQIWWFAAWRATS